MNLRQVKFKPLYNSYLHDVVQDFYILAFANAKYYDRVSAYFDSKILSLYARGISELIKQDGKIRFIFSYDISEEDYILMQQGYKMRDESQSILLSNFKTDELSDEELLHLGNLAYLISINLVEIKIAFTKSGILHDKFGLIYDDYNNYLYFRGSNNETVASIKRSYESFETSMSWHENQGEIVKIEYAKLSFNNLWNNQVDGVMVRLIPDVLKENLLKYSNGKIIPYFDIMNQISKSSETDVEYIRGLKSIYLDYSNDNIIGYNYVDNNGFDTRDSFYKIYIKRFINVIEGETIIFLDSLNYIDMQDIIIRFKEYGKKNKFDVVVAPRLIEYIKKRDIQIEKRKLLGISIKNMDLELSDDFNQFEAIVNSNLVRKLRYKQLWDAYHIVKMTKSANFSVPGAGKTSIVYGAYAYLNSLQLVDKIIVIGPLNSFLAWKEEFVANFGNKRKLDYINSSDFPQTKDLEYDLRFQSGPKNLILINYERVAGLQKVLNEIINGKVMIVFDEVHKIKNPSGIRAAASLSICSNAIYRVVLTGTPIPNSYLDIYNFLHILYAEEYKYYFKFHQKTLENPNDREINIINEKLFPFFCRTTKKDLHIPEPNDDNKLFVNLTKNEQDILDILYKKYRGNPFKLYLRIIQAVSNPELLLKSITKAMVDEVINDYDNELEFNENNNEIFDDLDYSDNEIAVIKKVNLSSKMLVGINQIRQLVESGKTVIAWGIFIDTLHFISDRLNEFNITNEVISGEKNLSERESLINDFKKGKFSVLITNPHTLAESVSLHHICHDSIYFEYSFNLTHMLQSRDRINRLGLKHDDYTQYHYLIAISEDDLYQPIDLKIYNRLKEKEEVMIEAIEGTRLILVNSDDKNDIKELLSKI